MLFMSAELRTSRCTRMTENGTLVLVAQWRQRLNGRGGSEHSQDEPAVLRVEHRPRPVIEQACEYPGFPRPPARILKIGSARDAGRKPLLIRTQIPMCSLPPVVDPGLPCSNRNTATGERVIRRPEVTLSC
jgi:hypothetical protein